MKKILLQTVLLVFCLNLSAQQIGDTIVVKAFKYGSTSRDTLINFPNNPSLTFEKIILKYNMRCKNNLVSTQSQRNQGCGEWDYSCSTFIVDSSKIDFSTPYSPSHVIAGFTGTVFPYSTQPIYDYYNFTQNQVTLNSIVSETQHTIGTGTSPAPNVLKTDERSGRTQLLYTAAELLGSGLTAGNIDGFIVNVINAGGGANFLRVGIQHTALNTLGSGVLSTTGFANVYNSNYTLTPGNNRIQFYTPFVWNGTSNILLDLSFTNNIPSNPVVLSGAATASVMALYSNNNYALDLASFGSATLATNNLSSISNQMSVTFWAYGYSAQLPANTTILEGYGNNINQRNFNVHLPWSDNNIYFDCGYSAGSYDRINKVASAAEQGGQWNHWAFTKNATSGVMRIYRNGVLWHSGTSKTKAISLLNLVLGTDINQSNLNWKGKLNQLTIWNTELSAADISAWMNREVNASHPSYNNLVAYYKLNQGTGLTINESVNNVNVTGVNLLWTYDWGHTLTRNSIETNIRPNLVFVKGTYALSTSTVLVTDSVARNTRVIRTYSFVSNATVTPVISDQVYQSGTLFLYHASARNIFNGETGVLTGTLATVAQNTIFITPLNYVRRFPYYNEIMSFVTPYGIGLNLGPNGKTWYYDMTDFTPILKGPKRLLMTLGGQFQEQMDLDFLFIVGTPPRNVIEFNQLWQGAALTAGAPISRINNDTELSVKTVTLPAAGKTFKIRSTITGHGSEGEFRANGGVINHFFNVNGGPNEFSWQITEPCSRNVIYPQGGTWVYDREGWCPGQSSLLKEFYIDPYVTPGSTVTLDYNCSNPPNPNGAYFYNIANQLVSYGDPNHSLDANIMDVLKPSNKVLYSRENPVCANPVILVQNTGSTTVTSLEINYKVNSGSALTHTWTGNLAYMDTAVVTLPIGTLWQNASLGAANLFEAEIVTVNSAVDQYSYNNVYRSTFSAPFAITNLFDIQFRTNNNFYENSYVLYDDMGNIIGQSNFTDPNTTYLDSYQFDGCCRLAVEDFGNNGLNWWAAPAQGVGFVRLRNASGSFVKTFEPDFGGGFEFSFVTFNPLSINKFDFSNRINLYPNPGNSKFTISGDGLQDAQIEMTDVLGHHIDARFTTLESGAIEISTNQLASGVYFVNIKRGDSYAVKKVIVN